MGGLGQWWTALTPLNQGFYTAAAFFSVFLVWQMASALLGLGGGEDNLEVAPSPDAAHASIDDAHETVTTFQWLSVRSLMAFFTLFSWAGALYLNHGMPVGLAVGCAMLWGGAALLIVAWLMHALRRLSSSGNLRIATCLGAESTVYLDIPATGTGEIRVLCSGVMTHVKARAAAGVELKAGTPVKVTRIIGTDVVEVVKL